MLRSARRLNLRLLTINEKLISRLRFRTVTSVTNGPLTGFPMLLTMLLPPDQPLQLSTSAAVALNFIRDLTPGRRAMRPTNKRSLYLYCLLYTSDAADERSSV